MGIWSGAPLIIVVVVVVVVVVVIIIIIIIIIINLKHLSCCPNRAHCWITSTEFYNNL